MNAEEQRRQRRSLAVLETIQYAVKNGHDIDLNESVADNYDEAMEYIRAHGLPLMGIPEAYHKGII